ncbi:CrcB family protein [Microbacterium chocolatum]|uniref:fluoride efflux transporter FluC n=1 Tax=Microbacterium aurantiacum TaxID=162393 RepID=UPI00338DEB1E
MNLGLVLLAALAGGLGAGARYALDRLITTRLRTVFPVGILVINVSGSFLLGLLTGLGTAIVPSHLLLVLGIGLLGGYTTFSTVAVETVLAVERREFAVAAGNMLGTLLLSVALALGGIALGAGIAVGY